MWILLAIALYADNDNMNVLKVRTFDTSDQCHAARQALQVGQPGTDKINTQFICQKKPRGL